MNTEKPISLIQLGIPDIEEETVEKLAKNPTTE